MSRAANSTVVRSPPAGPIAWMPIGSPVAVVVMGMVVAGVPAMLASAFHLSWSQYDRETPSTSMVRPNRSWSLLWWSGAGGGRDGQEQHVELVEESGPPVAHFVARRIGEQPRTVAL